MKQNIRYKNYGIDISSDKSGKFRYSIYLNPFFDPIKGNGFESKESAEKEAKEKVDSLTS